MAEIRDPKRFYYAMRGKYMREARQIGQKLQLAVTEEEDALWWEQYCKVMKRWRALKKPDGTEQNEAAEFQPHLNRKPEFNEAYVELTLQLKSLYARMNQTKSKQERLVIEDMIRGVKTARAASTVYTVRSAGAPAKKQ